MKITENPFDHILYEMEMYLQTYIINDDNDMIRNQMTINLLLESHAMHLRNLSNFFSKKGGKGEWRATEFIGNEDNMHCVGKKLRAKINHYTSNAICHLSKERKSESFKSETTSCYINAYQILSGLIQCFFQLLDTDVKPEFETDWKNEGIQVRASAIRSLLKKQQHGEIGQTGAV